MKRSVSRKLVVAVFLVCAFFVGALVGGPSASNLTFRLQEIRWTNNQPYAILESRYPPFAWLLPRFNMIQSEKLMVWRNGEWQLEGTPYDPMASPPIIEKIYPNRSEPLNLQVARYSVRVPHAEFWRLEVESFETRLLGHPLFNKHVSRDFFWKSPELPGVAKMLESNLTNAAALNDHRRRPI